MKRLPFRTRLALWTALLVVIVLTLFGAGTAWNLYNEQLEAFQKDDGGPVPHFNHKREARGIVDDLMEAYFLALPAAVVAAAIGGWWITGRALRPVRTIADLAEQIHAAELDRRIPRSEAADEIGRLTDVLNGMFDRLERSFAQAIRFSADASHELRTPLAILRGEIEGELKNAKVSQEQQAFLEGLLDQTLRLSGLTSKLLLLSQADAGRLRIEQVSTRLGVLLSDLVEDAEILALPESITIASQIPPDVLIDGDESLLRQAFLNLVDNAIKYNLPGGSVRIALFVSEEGVTIDIANTGPAIPSELRPRLFQRFFRADSSRTASTGGSGLGLSLAREIILAHQGDIELIEGDSDKTTFRVTLPYRRTLHLAA